jgi:TetR/AcrR family transcriptional regulator, transcriptional repressor for nem operon
MGRVSDAKPRLLEAALDLIWSRSYGAVTVDDICEQAGVKKGSFYYFFKSKDELVAAALDRKWDEVRPSYDRLFSASAPPLERLKNFFEYVYQHQDELRARHNCVLGCPFSSIGTEIIAADKTLKESVQRMIKAKIRYVDQVLRDLQAEGQLPGQDTTLLAKQVYAYLEGSLAQARVQNDMDLLRGTFDGTLKLLGIRDAVTSSQ